MTDDRLDLLQGTLEMLVLKALAGGGELHGFGILDWIRETSGEGLAIEEGALYPALHRMAKRGWIAGEWGISEKGRRAKYYGLTDEGRAALVRQEDYWERYVAAVGRLGDRAAEAT